MIGFIRKFIAQKLLERLVKDLDPRDIDDDIANCFNHLKAVVYTRGKIKFNFDRVRKGFN